MFTSDNRRRLVPFESWGECNRLQTGYFPDQLPTLPYSLSGSDVASFWRQSHRHHADLIVETDRSVRLYDHLKVMRTPSIRVRPRDGLLILGCRANDDKNLMAIGSPATERIARLHPQAQKPSPGLPFPDNFFVDGFGAGFIYKNYDFCLRTETSRSCSNVSMSIKNYQIKYVFSGGECMVKREGRAKEERTLRTSACCGAFFRHPTRKSRFPMRCGRLS